MREVGAKGEKRTAREGGGGGLETIVLEPRTRRNLFVEGLAGYDWQEVNRKGGKKYREGERARIAWGVRCEAEAYPAHDDAKFKGVSSGVGKKKRL